MYFPLCGRCSAVLLLTEIGTEDYIRDTMPHFTYSSLMTVGVETEPFYYQEVKGDEF